LEKKETKLEKEETKQVAIQTEQEQVAIQMKQEEDMLKDFLNECTEKSDTHLRIQTLYWGKFVHWHKNRFDIKRPSTKIFREWLKNYVTIENVEVNGHIALGIKNLRVIKDNDENI